MTRAKHRILVISHGHPDFSLGGGELAAYNLYNAYAGHSEVETAYFLACHDRGKGPTGAISLRRPNEYLWEQSTGDWFLMKSANTESLHRGFAELVRRLRPTVVHVHHYAHMGLELLQIIKQIDPSIRIVMTLHEFMAICFNNGQMIKAETNRLCFRESPDDCNRCFPQRSIDDFWLRKHRYTSFFRHVDQFVAPSEFLRQRYVDWGIEPDRIVYIENGQAESETLAPRPLAEGETRNRFAFFGQVNQYKGVTVLLQGLRTLKKSERRNLVLEMHGANLEQKTPEFQQMIADLRAPLEKDGCLQWVGPYEPFQMADRMADVDWVVIPSIWWENSPMVIQEAFNLGRPVVGSDIGGMAEKITDGVDGVHVPVGNAKAWGQTLRRLSQYTDEWDRLRAGITRPIGYRECADAHLALIGNLPSGSGAVRQTA